MVRGLQSTTSYFLPPSTLIITTMSDLTPPSSQDNTPSRLVVPSEDPARSTPTTTSSSTSSSSTASRGFAPPSPPGESDMEVDGEGRISDSALSDEGDEVEELETEVFNEAVGAEILDEAALTSPKGKGRVSLFRLF